MRGIVGNALGSEARKGQNLSCGVAARCFGFGFFFTETSSVAASALGESVDSSPSEGLVPAPPETFFAIRGGRAAAAAAAASRSKCRRNWSATCSEIHCAAFKTANEAGYSGRRVRRLSKAAFGIEIRTEPGCACVCGRNDHGLRDQFLAARRARRPSCTHSLFTPSDETSTSYFRRRVLSNESVPAEML